MEIDIIQDRLKTYTTRSKQEELNALKEIYQEITLAALARSDFFKIAAFQGGTCLRIIHKTKRFSEDLDFILQSSERVFRWHSFLNAIELEFNSFGLELNVKERNEAEGAIKTAFLKESSFGRVLELKYDRVPSDEQIIKIKLEIDTSPPQDSAFEIHFLDYPYPFSIVTQDLPSLFASKCHALLCRPYVKGRDWFDFLWYLSKKTPINLAHLKSALYQAGPYQRLPISLDKSWLIKEFKGKISSIDWTFAKRDVENFLKEEERKWISNWSRDLFIDLSEKIETL